MLKQVSHLFSQRKGQSILRWSGTLIAVVLLLYLLSQQGWDQIGAAIAQISWGRFTLALVLMVASRLAVVGRWYALLRGAGMGISVLQGARLTFAGLFASNFLPTTIGGDVVRLAGGIRSGFDRAILVASLIVDRLVGMAGMAVALLPLPLSLPSPALASQGNFRGATLTTWAGLITPRQGLLKRLWERSLQIGRRLLQALTLWLSRPGVLLASFIFTCVHMLCLFTQIHLFLEGMGEEMSFWMIAGLWSATYFVTLLPVSINGMGVQELSTTFFYATLGGVSNPNALTLALLIRALQMLASLPGAFFIPDILAARDVE